jgi:hypothetical protein
MWRVFKPVFIGQWIPPHETTFRLKLQGCLHKHDITDFGLITDWSTVCSGRLFIGFPPTTNKWYYRTALEGVLCVYLFHTARKKRINLRSSAFIRNTLIIIQKASIKQAKDILIFKFNKPRKFILSIVFQSLSVEMNVFQSSANSSCDSRFIHEIFSKGTGSD